MRAGSTLRLLKQFFAYCSRRGFCKVGGHKFNPAADLEAADLGVEAETARDRALSEDEIPAFWNALEAIPEAKQGRTSWRPSVQRPRTLSATVANALRLLLVVPVRTGTLLAAERSEIDFARALWTIPCAHLKLTTDQVRRRKGAPLVLPLSPLALRLVRRLFALGGERSKYVVTSPVTADEPLHDKALNKAVRRMFKRGALSLPGGPCVPHDLRRTARTHMAALGIPSEIAERCLGHVVAGRVEGTYDRHAYVDEMRAALEKWAERLSALVEPATPANVVPIKRKAPRARAAV